MSFSLEELRSTDRSELIRLHDHLARNTAVGVNYYLEELHRRDQDARTAVMVRLTKVMAGMTAAILVATVINVVFFVLG